MQVCNKKVAVYNFLHGYFFAQKASNLTVNEAAHYIYVR